MLKHEIEQKAQLEQAGYMRNANKKELNKIINGAGHEIKQCTMLSGRADELGLPDVTWELKQSALHLETSLKLLKGYLMEL